MVCLCTVCVCLCECTFVCVYTFIYTRLLWDTSYKGSRAFSTTYTL